MAETIQKTLEELKAEQLRLNMIRGSLGLAGAIGFCAYGFHKGYGFWGKVGMFFLGSIVAGIPVNLAFAKQITATETALRTAQEEASQKRFEELRKNALASATK